MGVSTQVTVLSLYRVSPIPTRDGWGQRPQTEQAPAKSRANVSIILGHFQKCLTPFCKIGKSIIGDLFKIAKSFLFLECRTAGVVF